MGKPMPMVPVDQGREGDDAGMGEGSDERGCVDQVHRPFYGCAYGRVVMTVGVPTLPKTVNGRRATACPCLPLHLLINKPG